MADIFAEIDEALRQERIAKFWNDNRLYIVGFVVLTILTTAALSGYRAWNERVKVRQTEHFTALLNAPDFPANLLENALPEMRPALRAMALINGAEGFIAQGDNARAQTLYERAAGTANAPKDFIQMATLMSVRLLSANEKTSAQSLLPRLDAIATDQGSPWAAYARLEAALVLAHKNQAYDAARRYLNPLIERDDIPRSLHTTAQALDHVYSLKSQAATPETTSAPTEPSQ